MTNDSDAADQKPATNKPVALEKPEAKKPGSGTKTWVSVLCALVIIALLLSAYALQKGRQQEKDTEVYKEDVRIALNQIKKTLKETSLHLSKTDKNLHELQILMQTRMQQQAQQNHMEKHQKQDWLLLKARYYLEMAQINTHWSDNQQASIALLQEADAVLQDISEPQLLAVRQAIAREIAQLKALPVPDVAGLLSKLDAVRLMINQLPIRPILNKPETVSGKPAENTSTAPWKKRLQDSVKLLERLVVVQKQNENFQPLFSPAHQALLRESIRINLQQAQWAILQKNPEVYQRSLQQVLQAVKGIFDSNTTQAGEVIRELQNLQKVILTTEKPSGAQSLTLLNQFIDSNPGSAQEEKAR